MPQKPQSARGGYVPLLRGSSDTQRQSARGRCVPYVRDSSDPVSSRPKPRPESARAASPQPKADGAALPRNKRPESARTSATRPISRSGGGGRRAGRERLRSGLLAAESSMWTSSWRNPQEAEAKARQQLTLGRALAARGRYSAAATALKAGLGVRFSNQELRERLTRSFEQVWAQIDPAREKRARRHLDAATEAIVQHRYTTAVDALQAALAIDFASEELRQQLLAARREVEVDKRQWRHQQAVQEQRTANETASAELSTAQELIIKLVDDDTNTEDYDEPIRACEAGLTLLWELRKRNKQLWAADCGCEFPNAVLYEKLTTAHREAKKLQRRHLQAQKVAAAQTQHRNLLAAARDFLGVPGGDDGNIFPDITGAAEGAADTQVFTIPRIAPEVLTVVAGDYRAMLHILNVYGRKIEPMSDEMNEALETMIHEVNVARLAAEAAAESEAQRLQEAQQIESDLQKLRVLLEHKLKVGGALVDAAPEALSQHRAAVLKYTSGLAALAPAVWAEGDPRYTDTSWSYEEAARFRQRLEHALAESQAVLSGATAGHLEEQALKLGTKQAEKAAQMSAARAAVMKQQKERDAAQAEG